MEDRWHNESGLSLRTDHATESHKNNAAAPCAVFLLVFPILYLKV